MEGAAFRPIFVLAVLLTTAAAQDAPPVAPGDRDYSPYPEQNFPNRVFSMKVVGRMATSALRPVGANPSLVGELRGAKGVRDGDADWSEDRRL